MNAIRTLQPIHPTAVRHAFNPNGEHPAVPGLLVGANGDRFVVGLLNGDLAEVVVDDLAFAQALRRSDLCRRDGREAVLLVNQHYGLVGLAVGPPEPPDYVEVRYGVARLENGSAVEIPGEPPQPSWLLFRCRVRTIAAHHDLPSASRETRAPEVEPDEPEEAHEKSEPDDEAGLEGERDASEAASTDREFGLNERKFRRLIPRLAQDPFIARAIGEGFGADGWAILDAVQTGAPLDATVADELYDVVREAFDSAATRVLSLDWFWGAVWVYECKGVYVVSADELESDGPFDSLEEALESDHFTCAPQAPDLICTELEEDKLLAFARGLMSWTREGSIRINHVEYVVDGDELRPKASEP